MVESSDTLARRAVGGTFTAVFVVLCAVLTGGGCAGPPLREVEKGRLYLSRLPDKTELGAFHERYRFRTIINLRGERSGSGWYEREVAFARENQVRFHSIGLSRFHGPTPEQLVKLFSVFDDESAYPILAHCWSGRDRSGVVGALYRIRQQGWEPETALGEMGENGFSSFWWRKVTRFVLSQSPNKVSRCGQGDR